MDLCGRGSDRLTTGEMNSAVPATIANAIFNATGVRLRTVPFTPERVKAELVYIFV